MEVSNYLKDFQHLLEKYYDDTTHVDRQPQRITWAEYYLGIAYMVASRSTCVRRKVGAIAVKNQRIIATGYNGAPRHIPHCTVDTCIRKKLNVPSGQHHELCMAVHAEQNVIIQAAASGTDLNGAVLFCTTAPCSICTKMLINCGISTIHYVEGYPDDLSKALWNVYKKDQKALGKDFFVMHHEDFDLEKVLKEIFGDFKSF